MHYHCLFFKLLISLNKKNTYYIIIDSSMLSNKKYEVKVKMYVYRGIYPVDTHTFYLRLEKTRYFAYHYRVIISWIS